MSVNLKLEVIQGRLKPIVKYDGIEMLFDTGADAPVWFNGLELFREVFPMAIKEEYKFLLSGFGRSRDDTREITESLENTICNTVNSPSIHNMSSF